MIIKSSFKPAWWLSNAHIQTTYPTLFRHPKSVVDRLERIELEDGDFIDLAWAINGLNPDTPLVLFLHGLGGSVESSYVAGQMQAYNHCGWRAVLMHFRGASHEPNRLMRTYHSGETSDLNFVYQILQQREPQTKKAIVGVSLGGNVLLKWLGEQAAQNQLCAAVAVSVPFQLRLVADRINQGVSKIYQRYLLNRMRAMFIRKHQKYQEQMDTLMPNVYGANCFWTFDDNVTAPMHGFTSVHHYYRQASSRPYLIKIATPTLIIHALDDPFMTPEVVPHEHELSNNVTLELSKQGGHVGFIAGKIPGKPIYWLDYRIPEFLKNFLI